MNGRACVREYLKTHPLQGNVYLVAIGKAAVSMTEGALDSLGNGITRGIVITKAGHGKYWHTAAIACLEAGHPLPDESSLAAGAALLDFIAAAPPDAQLLFLISGGASALVEVLPDEISLADLVRVHHWLLGAGLDIAQMNHVRKALSTIKGGRLAKHLCGRTTINLLISDVPDDDPCIIGSGLLIANPDDDTPDLNLPDWITRLIDHAPPLPLADSTCFKTIHTTIIATLTDAMHAAAESARQKDYAVHLHKAIFNDDAMVLGERFATELMTAEPGLHIWGGESTVVLPAKPGRGGRNQTLALAAAQKIKNRADIMVLAGATDGTDGPTGDAGALVDGATILRGEQEELNAAQCLARADTGRFLEASGDLIHTGPTGTNVMDLVLGLKILA